VCVFAIVKGCWALRVNIIFVNARVITVAMALCSIVKEFSSSGIIM
jgi:hypothetical protein